MPDLELPERPVVPALPDPRLSGTVDGVEFWVRLPRGHAMRCVTADGALQRHYGATDEPASWIAAFARHQRDIEKHAMTASARREDVHVVILNDAAGVLQAVAGRCVCRGRGVNRTRPRRPASPAPAHTAARRCAYAA